MRDSSEIKRFCVGLTEKIKSDYCLEDKTFVNVIYKCLVLFGLQVLSFYLKFFIFIELIVAIYFIIKEKYENKVYILFFLLPFYNVFRYGTTNSQYNSIFSNIKNMYFSVWVLLVFILLCLIKYIKLVKSKKIKINYYEIIGTIVIYLLLLFPFNKNISSAFSSLVVFSAIIMVCFFMNCFKHEIEIKKILSIWSIAVFLTIIVYIFKDYLPNLNDFLTYTSLRYSFLQRDPNYFGLEMFILMSTSAVLFFEGKVNVSFYVTNIVCSILIILTASKACFITLLIYFSIIIITLIVISINKIQAGTLKQSTFWVWFWILFFTALTIILVVLELSDLFIIERLSYNASLNGSLVSKLDSLTTGRFSIWIKYLKKSFSSIYYIVFGRGIFRGYGGEPNYTAIHNTYIQLLYFAGVILFLAIVALLIYYIIKHRKVSTKFVYIPLFIFLIMAASLDLMFSYRTYLIVQIFILLFNYKKIEDGDTK